MLVRRCIASLALVGSLALGAPAVAAPAPSPPLAQAAGGDAPPLTPSIVNVPIIRTESAIDTAALQIDQGNNAIAGRSLAAARRYLTRSYRGARYLIANAPPPVADEASVATARTFRRLARQAVREAKRVHPGEGWIGARVSGGAVGPIFADAPTAVFSVLTSQYDSATQTIGMLNDATGVTLTRVSTTLNRALTVRRQLVNFVRTSAPPPAEDAPEDAATFDTVMPGLVILLDDEIQQLRAAAADTSLPAAAQTTIARALRTDMAIKRTVNTSWPPATED
jgi:hypothetical protein